ncbi:hypothetical protein IMX07_04265 [bacterium]|nr:hypothetical protein [bacterium]
MIFFAAGCATIFTSSTEHVTVNSDPSGANFQYGPFNGTTPAQIEVPKKALASFATFSKPGYQTTTVPVVTGIQGATWWDILFPIGFVIDFVSGNANKLETPVITATLTPNPGTPPAAPAAGSPTPAPTPAS